MDKKLIAKSRLCVQLCEIAYENHPYKLEAKIKKHFAYYKVIEAGNVLGIVAWNDSFSKYIIYPGTNDIRDGLADINIKKVKDTEYGDVHEGFFTDWNKIRTAIMRHIIPTDKLTITGHSYGGPLGILNAMTVPQQCKVCITFGQPKMGGWLFAKIFREQKINLIRWVNDQDVVTKIPRFDWWSMWRYKQYRGVGYQHVGEPVYLDNDGVIIKKRRWSWTVKERIEDHFIKNYREAIDKL